MSVLGLVRILLLASVLGLNPLILRATSDSFYSHLTSKVGG